MTTPSRPIPWKKVLLQPETKIGRALAGGHLPSIAKSILGHETLRELLFKQFIAQIDSECSHLCQRQSTPAPVYRKVPQALLADFDWKISVKDLQNKARLSFRFSLQLLPIVITETKRK